MRFKGGQPLSEQQSDADRAQRATSVRQRSVERDRECHADDQQSDCDEWM